ncbi:MAG: type I-D CRISPR-associated protein Cas10d/Csc3 [Leptolyngbya sp. UWPOB_LEPTO1]|uniref:type I-D CRISPR-associated protein Cas10d/Csc3 n=1 Tax=Leptolyngbya sp. UWPOB_LEPTO1 TaxID=2815653 RepID=UPI001AD463C1|nr:type I-D CRISPR-associated protein Cas10d/Csc3 [Leptolyngbya sp. UWPOB_LEPTO1]MBN8563524.1 type I-D CRISPR-associated protein Cas10d/Csc3 [Leptolyngbya sp. UWPOB_LEPTO1]
MTKKIQNKVEAEQLLPDLEETTADLDQSDDWMDDSELEGESSSRTIDPGQRELLTLKLLREAIQAQNPNDAVMQDFAEYVLPNLLRIAIGVTAKGGQFFEQLDRQREAEGKTKVRRDNAGDQSLNTHLLNGLFPANLIEQRLEKMDTTIRRVVKEKERRLAIAGFILHDFEKFPDAPDDCRKLAIAQHRQIIDQKVQQLGLDQFIDPNNTDTYRDYIDDLLCIAYNAQRRWDTNWNFSEYGLDPILNGQKLSSLANLACLADSLASIVKHPYDAESSRLKELIHTLSDGKLKLTYHSISENRGALTNVVNNALVDAHTSLNTDECIYEPLLYLPTGVIYLAIKDAPAIDPSDLPDRVVNKIKDLCTEQLRLRQTGFGRDGKGMKYADYYTLFCDDRTLMQIALDATLRILSSTKASVAKSRNDKLLEFQQKGALSADYDFSFGDDIRIDQIAEFGDVVSRKIWGDRVEKITTARKQNKKLPELPELNLTQSVAESLGLAEYLPQIREIQKINETLKEQKIKGSTGGIPYEWYYLAAKYLERHPGIENVRELCEQIIACIADQIEPIVSQYQLQDGWEDLRSWIQSVVMLPQSTPPTLKADQFLKELANYNAAKKVGRGKQLICSISHSAYTVTEQMESSVLFTPQVYTNKQMLGGGNAKRNISSIASLEIMLRQILMNQTQAVGKRFEDGKYRYLYFYPTYYFTPETNRFLQKAYTSIAQTRFDTTLRNHFISKSLEADFGRERYQSIDTFLMDEEKENRVFKLSYPEDQPLTFYFMALPPGKDPNDTESWVMPAWLGFAFPMILDVKTVVSESPIPPFTDGAEFEESVFLDSAPQAIRVLVKRDRFRLDAILEGWNDADGTCYPAPLNVLTAAYAIHLEVNAKQGKGGYDADWGKLTELAKDFETSPLYVFNYLNRWIRKQKNDTARIEKIRLYAHHFYPCFDPYVEFDPTVDQLKLISPEKSPMNHPQKLTDLYRKFYRANRRYNPKANAVLKPIDVAAEVLLKADSIVFDDETLIAVVASEVFKLMDRVRASRAEGFNQIFDREEERQAILDFARYFVVDVFQKAFASDRARLAGRQLNLLRDTCEFLYRLEQDKENRELKAKGEASEDEDAVIEN